MGKLVKILLLSLILSISFSALSVSADEYEMVRDTPSSGSGEYEMVDDTPSSGGGEYEMLGNSTSSGFEEGSIQECRALLTKWKDTCKTATTREEINRCNDGRICVRNGSDWNLTTAGTPFDSEFFDVTDAKQGLVAPGQKIGEDSRFTDGFGNRGLTGILYVVINFLAQMVSVVALLVMIVGIFFLITANGDDNQITKGKDAIKYSIMGIVFVLLSYTIVLFVQSVFY